MHLPGANLKRIEREISVSEQEFLEILHGLNLAKLKMQDNELSSNIKPVDQPFYPLNPIPYQTENTGSCCCDAWLYNRIDKHLLDGIL